MPMIEVKMYNRTTSPVVFKSAGGSFTLAASNSPGVDGPEYNVSRNHTSIRVFSESSKQLKELLDAGSIRIDPAGPAT